MLFTKHLETIINIVHDKLPEPDSIDLKDYVKLTMENIYRLLSQFGEEEQFKIAIACVLLAYPIDSYEYKCITIELRGLIALSNIILSIKDSLPIDTCTLENTAKESEQYKPIGLLKIWDEVKDKMS